MSLFSWPIRFHPCDLHAAGWLQHFCGGVPQKSFQYLDYEQRVGEVGGWGGWEQESEGERVGVDGKGGCVWRVCANCWNDTGFNFSLSSFPPPPSFLPHHPFLSAHLPSLALPKCKVLGYFWSTSFHSWKSGPRIAVKLIRELHAFQLVTRNLPSLWSWLRFG